MSQSRGGEVPAEETAPSKASIEEEERRVEGYHRGNSTSRRPQVVCVILSSQVPNLRTFVHGYSVKYLSTQHEVTTYCVNDLDTSISSSRSQEFPTRCKSMKPTECNGAGVDASEGSSHLQILVL